MSDLVFVQPETDQQRAARRQAITERVQELLVELDVTGTTSGEVRLSPSEAPPFGGTLVIDLDPGREQRERPESPHGKVTVTSRGQR